MPSGMPCCWAARAISRSQGRATSAAASAAPALQINRAATKMRRHVLIMTGFLVGLLFLTGLPGLVLRLTRRRAGAVERRLRLRRLLVLARELGLLLARAGLESVQRAVLHRRDVGNVARRLHQF